MGQNANFFLNTDYYDTKGIFNSSDIEDNTRFNTTIYSSDSVNYEVSCRLWKLDSTNVKIFCKLKDPTKFSSNARYYLNSVSFNYKSYKININRPSTDTTFYKLTSLPFIYSGQQVIDLEDGKDLYELKFRCLEYNNEPLHLTDNGNIKISFSCTYIEKDNNLICQLQKEEIEEILINNIQNFEIYSYNDHPYLTLYKIETIENIIINKNVSQKTDIYVGINKLLTQYIDWYNYIAYETNITNIANVHSQNFYLQTSKNNFRCFFKKNKIDPLFLLCYLNSWSDYLGIIDNEIILDNINILYNFRIQPGNNTEYFYASERGSIGITLYPKILDFSQTDRLTINFIMQNPKDCYPSRRRLRRLYSCWST